MILSKQLLNEIVTGLLKMPNKWNARKIYLEWKRINSRHFRQTEWIGWRFQELCEQYLKSIQKFNFSPQRYGYADFDAFAEIPWDFKTHIRQNPRGQQTHKVPGTDRRATFQAIKDYGAVGFIIGIGDAVFNDKDRSFQLWHNKLKGGLSEYEKERVSRGAPSRLRKTAFSLCEIWIIEVDEKLYKNLETFMEGFRNRDGNPRKAKVMLDLNKIEPIYKIEFS
ncbi:MAG: hypothetical protein M1501_00085 [Candidatus Omnitrophica bacterium]|nr:hypothetical protein [Candidatus Omnitrophota bacterium]